MHDKDKFSIVAADIYFGITVDESFNIMMDDVVIGKGCMSKMEKADEIFLEYIELLPEYRGKHLLRPVLLAISVHYSADAILLESDIIYEDTYIHLGATKTEYCDFREMQGFRLTQTKLKSN